MRKIYFLSIITFAIACNQKEKTDQNKTSATGSKVEVKGNFDWLSGNWRRLNDKEGKETFENWKKISSSEYSGIGFTMQKGNTINQEQISLIESNGKWNLFVQVPSDKEPIKFKMTEFGNDKFICVNDSIDFPKRIQYWLEKDKLKAKISNEKMDISFEFEKVE